MPSQPHLAQTGVSIPEPIPGIIYGGGSTLSSLKIAQQQKMPKIEQESSRQRAQEVSVILLEFERLEK